MVNFQKIIEFIAEFHYSFIVADKAAYPLPIIINILDIKHIAVFGRAELRFEFKDITYRNDGGFGAVAEIDIFISQRESGVKFSLEK